jgi:hypothetical protein
LMQINADIANVQTTSSWSYHTDVDKNTFLERCVTVWFDTGCRQQLRFGYMSKLLLLAKEYSRSENNLCTQPWRQRPIALS